MAKLISSPLMNLLLLIIFTSARFFFSGVLSDATFTFNNKCDYPVWPGILSNAGIAPLSTTGFVLQKGESQAIAAPSSWGGRFWGRTHCGQDSAGKFSCLTGDCGSGEVQCSGGGAAPPATLAEFTLNGHGGMDFYDVSLVDGYNLPMLVVPQGGSGTNCSTTGCVGDLNGACPSELKVMTSGGDQGVACRSACEAFGEEQYCCSGAYNTPATCKPSSYSELFKSVCPHAYSYAYDDGTSTFTCTSGASYLITFCPAPNTSQKSSSGGQNSPSSENDDNNNNNNNNNTTSMVNGSMVYQGASELSNASTTTCMHVFRSGVVAFVVAMWQLFSTRT